MEKLIDIQYSDELTKALSATHDGKIELYEGETVLITGLMDTYDVAFINLLLGVTSLPNGGISVFGEESISVETRQKIGVVFEDATLISNLKVVENVELPMQYHTNLSDYDIMEKALLLLDKIGYRDNIWRLPGTLPFYVRKKVALARAMALDPAIVIYDSIYKGLYEHELRQLIDNIIEFNKEAPHRLSIFLTSNEQHNALKDTNIKFDRIINLRVIENKDNG